MIGPEVKNIMHTSNPGASEEGERGDEWGQGHVSALDDWLCL